MKYNANKQKEKENILHKLKKFIPKAQNATLHSNVAFGSLRY